MSFLSADESITKLWYHMYVNESRHHTVSKVKSEDGLSLYLISIFNWLFHCLVSIYRQNICKMVIWDPTFPFSSISVNKLSSFLPSVPPAVSPSSAFTLTHLPKWEEHKWSATLSAAKLNQAALARLQSLLLRLPSSFSLSKQIFPQIRSKWVFPGRGGRSARLMDTVRGCSVTKRLVVIIRHST